MVAGAAQGRSNHCHDGFHRALWTCARRGVSLSARGGGDCRAVWGVAFPALVFLMCVSTIWGRYHYTADIFGGIVTGTLGYFIGKRVMKRKGAVTTDETGMYPERLFGRVQVGARV